MPDVDPADHDITELGPLLNDVEDADELRAILDAERTGRDRDPVVTLIQSRIDAVSGTDDGDPGEIDPAEHSPAELGNLVRDTEEPERLEALLVAEETGENRSSAKTVIENRLETVRGGDREDSEVASPEQRHPELDHPTADKRHVRALEGGVYRDMWVYCETQQGGLLGVSEELLGKARELMDGYNERYGADERVVAVLIGDGVGDLAGECVALGADVVVYQEDERLARFRHTPYTEVFCDMARGAGHPHGRADGEAAWRDYDEPRYTLFPATNNGRDLSALVQAELDSGLASDCSDLYIENADVSNPAKTGEPGTTRSFERVLQMKRPDFSGFEYSTILCLDTPSREFHPQGASVIPGSFAAPTPDPAREGLIVEHDTPLATDWLAMEVAGVERLDRGVDLSGHDVVVAMGRGIGSDPTGGIELGLELVDAFEDAALGLSRGVITAAYEFDGHVAGYVAEERQIGESGQVVEPELYVACGISGAVQHKVGMDESETIVAINTDPEADVREFSDYFVEGDLFEVVPALVDSLEHGELRLGEAVAADGGEQR